jgi:hypothetical protein
MYEKKIETNFKERKKREKILLYKKNKNIINKLPPFIAYEKFKLPF